MMRRKIEVRPCEASCYCMYIYLHRMYIYLRNIIRRDSVVWSSFQSTAEVVSEAFRSLCPQLYCIQPLQHRMSSGRRRISAHNRR